LELIPSTAEIDWVAELRSVLTHWHNTSYLENHRLAHLVWSRVGGPHATRAQALRRAVRLAIEALQPIAAYDPSSPDTRPSEILHRHYIAKQGIPKIALDLNICEREAYRELRLAMEALGQILQGMYGSSAADPLSEGDAKLSDEVQRLAAAKTEIVDIVHLLAEASTTGQQLARDRRIHIDLASDVDSLHVVANRVMLRQAILNLLSYMVRNHHGDQILVQLHCSPSSAMISFRYKSALVPNPADASEPYAVAAQLLDSLGVQWSREPLTDGCSEVHLHIPVPEQRTVLLVDDNEGLTTLFTRYLGHLPFRVYSANDFQTALDLAQQLQPDVVVIDVMMPGHDGWELIERVRAIARDGCPRVIVCSIINDPELALALGADAFLHKPVDRADLLDALDQVVT
jgi:CheY-like chemotaxis protein